MISVLMPYRDAAPTIARAIESILAQRGVALELLAVDDGSRDESAAIVRALAERDARVRPLVSVGAGIVAALECGRRVSACPWIARMDADDVSHEDRLGEQLAALERDPRIAALGTRVELFSEDGPIGEGMQRYVEWQNALVTPADHARDLFVESPLCHPSVLLRRDSLDAVGGWRDAGWAEDYDLWLRLDAAGYELAKLPRVLLSWRVRPGSATHTRAEYSEEALRAARAAFLAPKLRDRPVAIWGAGPIGRRLARALEAHGVRAARFVDIDPRKIGRTARGAAIVAPDALSIGDQIVVAAVGSRGARAQIREHLATRGFVEGRDFICAA